MKHIIFALSILSLTLFSSVVIARPALENPIQINFKYDLPGKLNLKIQDQTSQVDMDGGVAFGLEYGIDKSYGFGAEYRLERSKISTIPMYFYFKTDNYKAGIQGNFGYNALNLSNSSNFSSNGGLYMACSAFVRLNDDLKAVAQYSICNGTVTGYGETIDLSYPTVSLGIALNLN